MNPNEAGGWLWLAIDVFFVVLLAAALIYGIMMWHNRRRDRALQQRRDEATRELYHRPNNQ